MNKYYEDYDNIRTYNWKMERKIREVQIKGTKTLEMPIWMIYNYIKTMCDNYTKLVYCLKIINIFLNKESDIVDIGISTSSVPVDQDGKDFENKLIDYVRHSRVDNNREKFCLMMSPIPGERKRDFWHYFSSCERPICFAVTKDNDVILLYNPRGDEGIKVCNISYYSPIYMGWCGIGECIEHLVNAGVQVRNDRRLQDEHEARMATQAMKTLREGISVQIMLQNTNLPGSQKEYLQSMYNGIMAKQEKLNEQLGIYCPELNVRI